VILEHSTEAVQERAALYAAGALLPDERQAFEAHLRDCADCTAEVEAFAAVAAQLGEVAAPIRPPDRVRERVLAAAARSAAEDAIVEQNGVRFVRSRYVAWRAGDAPALFVRPLAADRERGYRTSIVRMEPGAVYPSHRHAEVEETFLIEGDLTVNGVEMRPGDYCRAEAGTVHTAVSTRNGCVFLALTSERDELLT
jgi:anti-sigma factor ChrR (cupin superfamily)